MSKNSRAKRALQDTISRINEAVEELDLIVVEDVFGSERYDPVQIGEAYNSLITAKILLMKQNIH